MNTTMPTPTSATTKKQRGVVWLTKEGINLGVIGQPITSKLVFQPGIVSYLEIIDEAKLKENIRLFVEQNKVPMSSLILVLGADVLFEKEMSGITPDQIQKVEDEFKEIVPFENVYVKTWNLGTTFRLVACNADLFNYIRISFEKLGFDIVFAIPYFSTGKNSFDNELASELWKKSDQLRAQNTIENYTAEGASTTTNSRMATHSRREILLIGGFFVLLLILLVVGFMRFM